MEENKNKPNSIDRRCFIAGCAKFALGASLLSLTRNSYGNYSDTWEDYTICIFKCPDPCTYDPSCKGCRSDEKTNCTTKNCAIEKEMKSCAHCANLKDCDKDLWIKYPKQREFALKKQAEWKLI